MGEWKRLFRSFGYAITGIVTVFKNERNMQIHGWMGLLITILSIWVKLPWWQFLPLLFAVIWVWTMEILNTAIEKTLDTVTQEWHPLVKAAKDHAAGAVLLPAGFAVVLGLTFLFPPLMHKVDAFSFSLKSGTSSVKLIIASSIVLGLLLWGLYRWNRILERTFWLPIVGAVVSFLCFIFINYAWLKVITLFLPIVCLIFFRRGSAFWFGLIQIVLAGFCSWIIIQLIYYF